MVDGAKWQPYADQFPYACRVCKYGEDTVMTVRCEACRMEKRPGFEFEPHRYLDFCKSQAAKQRAASREKELEKDRDFWKNLVEVIIRLLK